MGRRAAVTLIEVLVVVALVGVVVALSLPAVLRAREAASRAACLNHLKQLGAALHGYHDARGVFPSGHAARGVVPPTPHLSWLARLLPHLEQAELWAGIEAAFAADQSFRGPTHHDYLGRRMPGFVCPSSPRSAKTKRFGGFSVAFTSYLGVSGTDQKSHDGLLFSDSAVRLVDVTDGTASVLAVGERPPSLDSNLGWWYAGWGQAKDGSAEMILGVREVASHPSFAGCPPESNRYQAASPERQCDALHFWSEHPGGGHFLFADGAARFIVYGLDSALPALATRGGGEPVAAPG